MNTIIFRTLQDEPGNEHLIRGIQKLNDSSDRLINAHARMIQAGNYYCDQVQRILNGE